MFFFKTFNAVSLLLPVDYAVEIFVTQGEIAERREFKSLLYCLQHRRSGGETHIGYPHGYGFKTLVRLYICKRNNIGGYGVFSAAVKNSGKIIFHILQFSLSVYDYDD
ncbi:hypothetical protein EVA_11539 [gut metagenome]|uniref:Uncharacterized protein n=1 Tax=gut metagenome TaxID=749906 RepID=J9CJU4_9ZZZZ